MFTPEETQPLVQCHKCFAWTLVDKTKPPLPCQLCDVEQDMKQTYDQYVDSLAERFYAID